MNHQTLLLLAQQLGVLTTELKNAEEEVLRQLIKRQALLH